MGVIEDIPIIVVAVAMTVGIVVFAFKPLSHFIETDPTAVMLALTFLVLIGLVLIADGFGFHVLKGYIYAAMGFSVRGRTAQYHPAQQAPPNCRVGLKQH